MWLLSWWGVLRQMCPLFPPVTSKTSNIRANFENLAKEREQEDRRKAEAERAQRMAKERQEQEEARRKLEVSNDAVSVPEPWRLSVFGRALWEEAPFCHSGYCWE